MFFVVNNLTVCVEDVFCAVLVEADGGSYVGEGFGVADVGVVSEVVFEQGELKLVLAVLGLCPVEQLVCAESIVDSGAVVQVEGDSQGQSDRLQVCSVLSVLLGRGLVFPGDMFHQVFAFVRHLWIQLKRMPSYRQVMAG